MREIKIGDVVEGTMNHKDWFKGIYTKESEIFVPHGIVTEVHNEIRYFTSMRLFVEEYTEEEKAEGWGTCSYCSEEEDECGCNTDDTERFYR